MLKITYPHTIYLKKTDKPIPINNLKELIILRHYDLYKNIENIKNVKLYGPESYTQRLRKKYPLLKIPEMLILYIIKSKVINNIQHVLYTGINKEALKTNKIKLNNNNLKNILQEDFYNVLKLCNFYYRKYPIYHYEIFDIINTLFLSINNNEIIYYYKKHIILTFYQYIFYVLNIITYFKTNYDNNFNVPVVIDEFLKYYENIFLFINKIIIDNYFINGYIDIDLDYYIMDSKYYLTNNIYITILEKIKNVKEINTDHIPYYDNLAYKFDLYLTNIEYGVQLFNLYSTYKLRFIWIGLIIRYINYYK